MKRIDPAQALLILAAFLAPVFGGYVASDKTAVPPGGLLSAMGEGQVPILQHALIALPALLALAFLLVRRRVQQIPHPYVAAALFLLVGGLAPAVATGPYRGVAVNVWIEWSAYGAAYLAAVSGLGRRTGPMAVLAAVFVATVWVAVKGVLEYGEMRTIDPTWRIFAGWSNPNATAAMLTLGFFCGMALVGSKERLAVLGTVVGGGIILFALFLTGSKGATLFAFPLGLVAYALALDPRNRFLWIVGVLALPLVAVAFLKSLTLLVLGLIVLVLLGLLGANGSGRVAASIGLGVLLILGLLVSAPKAATATAGVTPGSRIAAPSTTQDQSAIFRLNLWKSALKLAEERPVLGWGLGSYRYESSRPGLVTETIFAHNTYLQLAAEAGFGAPLVFFAFLGLWAYRSLRGLANLPPALRTAFAAALGGVVSGLVHAMVDSDFSYFGFGLALFLVLGAATLLATDAVAPEFVPRPSRLLAAAGIVGLGLLYLILGMGDLTKSQIRYEQGLGGRPDVDALNGLRGWDGDAAYLWAFGQPDPEPGMKEAYSVYPTPRYARMVAQLQERRGDFATAASTLLPALAPDPNNLATLYLLMRVQKEAGDFDQARQTARRLVGVEATPYFQVRSLDQLVPTQTYLARIEVLADAETDPKRKADVLAEGVRGLREYADVTAPEVARVLKSDPHGDYAGETAKSAQEKLSEGAEAARTAERLYRQLGDTAAAEAMNAQAAALEKAIPSE